TKGPDVYASVYNVLINGQWFDYLGKWDGISWSVFGNGLNAGFIDALAWQGSTLYVGGSFGVSDDGTRLNGIAQLQEGQWGSLNNGLNNNVYALAVSGD